MSAVNDRENLNMESVPKSVNYIQVAQHLLACVRENGKLSVAKSILRDMSKEVQKEIVNTTVDGDTPLSLAAQLGHVHLVNYLLDECGADIEKRGLVEVSRKCYQVRPEILIISPRCKGHRRFGHWVRHFTLRCLPRKVEALFH